MRILFVFNICLWCVLFVGWLVFVGLVGFGGPVSIHVAFILGITAVLLEIQGIIRWRRRRGLRVSA